MQPFLDQIDHITQQFRTEFGSLSYDELTLKPNDNEWSIAQNIEHLISINNSYFEVIRQAREGSLNRSWLSRFSWPAHFLGRLLFKAIQPDRKRKLKTLSAWNPSKDSIESGILDRFEEHQNEFKELIKSAESLMDSDVIIHSPISKHLVLPYDQTIDILITHEKRHLNQAREVHEKILSTE